MNKQNPLLLADVRKYENLELLARELVEGFITGLHRSPYHGFSVEFAEHKLYNYGESTRHIDWKVFARTDRLYTKQYEEETNLRCSIVLDTSGSMYYPKPGNDKIAFSIYCAAALSYLMVSQRDAVGLVACGESIQAKTAQKTTRAHLQTLLTQLHLWLTDAPINENKSNLSKNLHELAESLNPRSLVIIFSDLFEQEHDLDTIMGAFQHLKHRKHEVLLFHVSDYHSEYQFAFDDRPYKFIDAETQESITISPSFFKAAYVDKMKEYYEQIKMACGKLKIDLIEANTSDSFDKILGAYLIKRKKLG